MDLLMVYEWPGNVRQLANEVQRLVAYTSRGGQIEVEQLSPAIRRGVKERKPGQIRSVEDLLSRESLAPPRAGLGSPKLADAVAALEQQLILAALARHEGNVSQAAAELGLSRKGLYLKLERYQVKLQ
jgi:DNA-binding NtrC family response regulator